MAIFTSKSFTKNENKPLVTWMPRAAFIFYAIESSCMYIYKKQKKKT